MFKTVLITSGRMPVALEVARSLKRRGVRIVAIDSIPLFICQSSRAVSASYVVPSPAENFSGYKQALLDLVEKESIDLILPMTEDVFYLSQFAAELPASCELFAFDHDRLIELHHKQKFIDFAMSLGLAVPESKIYRDFEYKMDLPREDYILKKAYSRAGTGIIFAKADRHPRSYDVPGDGSWIIQEKLKGKQVCSCTILDRGRIVTHVAYEPAVVNGTTSIVFKEAHAPSVLSWIQAFAEKTKFHGTVSFDFFVDEQGVARAIECNPRPTSGYHVIPREVLASALIDRQQVERKKAQIQRAQILLPSLMAVPALLMAKKLWVALKEIFKARDVIFDFRDCIPLFYQIPCAISVIIKSFEKGVPASSCMMDGVQWDEQPTYQVRNQTLLTHESEIENVRTFS